MSGYSTDDERIPLINTSPAGFEQSGFFVQLKATLIRNIIRKKRNKLQTLRVSQNY